MKTATAPKVCGASTAQLASADRVWVRRLAHRHQRGHNRGPRTAHPRQHRHHRARLAFRDAAPRGLACPAAARGPGGTQEQSGRMAVCGDGARGARTPPPAGGQSMRLAPTNYPRTPHPPPGPRRAPGMTPGADRPGSDPAPSARRAGPPATPRSRTPAGGIVSLRSVGARQSQFWRATDGRRHRET